MAHDAGRRIRQLTVTDNSFNTQSLPAESLESLDTQKKDRYATTTSLSDHRAYSRIRRSMSPPIFRGNPIRTTKRSCRSFYLISLSLGALLLLLFLPLKLIINLSSFNTSTNSDIYSDIDGHHDGDLSSLPKFQNRSSFPPRLKAGLAGNTTTVANCDSLLKPFMNKAVPREEYEAAHRLFIICQQEALKQHPHDKSRSSVDVQLHPLDNSNQQNDKDEMNEMNEPDAGFRLPPGVKLNGPRNRVDGSNSQLDDQNDDNDERDLQQLVNRLKKESSIHDLDDSDQQGVPVQRRRHDDLIEEENDVDDGSRAIRDWEQQFGKQQKLADTRYQQQQNRPQIHLSQGDVSNGNSGSKPLRSDGGVGAASKKGNSDVINGSSSNGSNLSSNKTSNKLSPMLQLRRDLLRQYGTWYGCDADPTILAMKGQDIRKPIAPAKKGFLQTKKTTNNKAVAAVAKRLKNESGYGKDIDSQTVDLDLGDVSNAIYGRVGANANRAEEPLSFGQDFHVQTPMGFLQSHGISPIAESPYRFGLLFMINKELRHPRLWTQWLENAYTWSWELYERREGPYSAVGGDEPFVPLFSLHVHFMGQGGGLYTSLKNVWRKWGLLAVEDSLKEAADDPRLKLPQVFQDAIIPAVHCGWGDLNPCEHQLLKYGMKDPSTNGFAFISESTVPVKPFHFIYNEFQRNPRSRFFFSNVNLPLVRKHHQWIVLNRQHAAKLVDNPEKWTCSSWLVHHYPHWHVIGNFAASDEYLPFYAISDMVGIDTVMLEVNSGKQTDLRRFNNTFQVHGDRNFRHTWLCWWELPDFIDAEPCGIVGEYSTRLSSPVTYYKIFAQKFQELVIQNRNAWFARKFEKDCTVQLDAASAPSSPLEDIPIDSRGLADDDIKVEARRNPYQPPTIPDLSVEKKGAPNRLKDQQPNKRQRTSGSVFTSVFSDFVGSPTTSPQSGSSSEHLAENLTVLLEDWLMDILLNDQASFASLSLHTYEEDIGK